jgi:very-short-patch-repair endonuclease
VELTSTREARSRPGITVYRSRTLSLDDAVRWHTTYVRLQERTLIDLADVLDHNDLTRVTDSLKTIDKPALEAALKRAGPRKARTSLKPLLHDGPRNRSDLERAFMRLVTKHRLPTPQCNVWLEGLLVDAHWPDHALVAECDSRRWHGTWAQRRVDHARDATLQRAGLRAIRVTWDEVFHHPAIGAERLRPFLRAPSSARRSPS